MNDFAYNIFWPWILDMPCPKAPIKRAEKRLHPDDLTKDVEKTIDKVFYNKKKRIFGIKFANGDVVTVRLFLEMTRRYKSFKSLAAKRPPSSGTIGLKLGGNTGNYNKLFKKLDTAENSEKA